MSEPVVFLPGILMPAGLRYGPLLEHLGADVQAVVKDLEVYAADVPPPGYSMQHEIDGIERAADAAGFERFHLYGHSGGGACALAYAAARPQRVRSLALDEPSTDFSDVSLARTRDEFASMATGGDAALMGDFVAAQLRPGTPLPPRPDGPPPAWMANRPAGVRAFIGALAASPHLTDALTGFPGPVLYSYGTLSHESWEQMAHDLAKVFPDLTVERYEGLHHLNTSHVAQPERAAETLRALWARA